MTARKTAREAARSRTPLDGADAQALEGALTMTEQERDAAIAERDAETVEVAHIREELVGALESLNAIRKALGMSRDRDADDIEGAVRLMMSDLAARERASEAAARTAIAERDRLRRELETLRTRARAVLDSSESVADALRDIAGDAHSAYLEELRYVSERLGAILRGES